MSATRIWLSLLLLSCVVGSAAAQQAAESPRQRLLADYGWTFTTGDPVGAEQPAFDDSGWRSVDLPHDWSIEGPYDEAAATTGRGGYLPTGVGWYRRSFTLPEGSDGRHVWIEFDGVYQNSDVWINGQHVGHRPYGYVSFYYDLTSHLQAGENVIAVRVDNSRQPNSRWYSGSGIYRHVWLTITDPLHVAQWGTFVTTPEVDSARAVVDVRTRLVNDGRSIRRGEVRDAIVGAPAAQQDRQHHRDREGQCEVRVGLGVEAAVRILRRGAHEDEQPQHPGQGVARAGEHELERHDRGALLVVGAELGAEGQMRNVEERHRQPCEKREAEEPGEEPRLAEARRGREREIEEEREGQSCSVDEGMAASPARFEAVRQDSRQGVGDGVEEQRDQDREGCEGSREPEHGRVVEEQEEGEGLVLESLGSLSEGVPGLRASAQGRRRYGRSGRGRRVGRGLGHGAVVPRRLAAGRAGPVSRRDSPAPAS